MNSMIMNKRLLELADVVAAEKEFMISSIDDDELVLIGNDGIVNISTSGRDWPAHVTITFEICLGNLEDAPYDAAALVNLQLANRYPQYAVCIDTRTSDRFLYAGWHTRLNNPDEFIDEYHRAASGIAEFVDTADFLALEIVGPETYMDSKGYVS